MPHEGEAALPEDRERVHHMLAAAKDGVSFAEGRSREDLDTDRMFARAVLHATQEIGEAAARVTSAGRAQAQEVPWGSIVQMRHILVHAYFSVNFDYVRRVIEHDLRPLIEQLEVALRNWG
jgi:uncharacterized protein with HEPN domain